MLGATRTCAFEILKVSLVYYTVLSLLPSH